MGFMLIVKFKLASALLNRGINCSCLWDTSLCSDLCDLAITSWNSQDMSPVPWQNIANTV